MKKTFIISILLIAIFTFAGCASGLPEETTSDISSETGSMTDDESKSQESSSEENLRVFSLEELSEYDGKGGRKAYVAVDGFIYDVTDVSAWRDGSHFRGTTAGKDLSDVLFNDAPHGARVLENLTVVGRLDN